MPGIFVVSLDFELHWGVRDRKSVSAYQEQLAGARKVVPALLERFAERGVHATWATVGFLFCGSRDELLESAPDVRPAYHRTELSPYPMLDEIGEDEDSDPFHYAPSLVERIRDTAGQEVASHTFSHFYCLEPGATIEAFRADLKAANRAADRLDIELESLVFPRNQFQEDALAVCREEGFTAVRGNPDSTIYSSRSENDEGWVLRGLRWMDSMVPLSGSRTTSLEETRSHGVVEIPASAFLRPTRREPTGTLRLRRIEQEMRQAAIQNEIFHLWWHPHNLGGDPEAGLTFVDEVLDSYDELRAEYGMESLGMAEVARRVQGDPHAK